jgi:MFS family permease
VAQHLLAQAAPTGADGSGEEPRAGFVAWFSVGILLLLTVLSSVDRTIIALMIDPIKADLHLTDVEFSVLQGGAFVVFYALASLPMAWIADRTSRHWVIFFGVTGWSIATALCGLAQNFWHLFAARLGVGAGEATLTPSAYALVGELFPSRRLGFAVGVLAAGMAIGGGAAYAIAGHVVAWSDAVGGVAGLASWQVAFVVVGLPGIALAPLIFLVPGGRRKAKAAAADPQALVDGQYLAWLRTNAAVLVPAFLGIGFHAVLPYGVTLWTPAYLSRHFGMGPAEVGSILALVTGLGGVVGFIGGGWLTDRLQAMRVREAQLRYCLMNCVAVGVIGIVAFTVVPSFTGFVLLLALANILFPLTGPLVSHLQLMTPPAYRARTIALLTVTFNLIGMFLGPMSVALFSDRVFGGPEHIGLGIAATFALFAPISALFFLLALKPARRAAERFAREGGAS